MSMYGVWPRWWRPLLPLLLAPALLVLFALTPLDHALVQPWFDPATRSFPLRHSFLLEGLMHDGLKFAVAGVALGVLLAWLLSFVVPTLEPRRRQLLWTAAGMALATGTVSLLKHHSALHCPWDLAEFGGYAPFHGLLDTLSSAIAPGHCFPGGHAAGGYALMALYFGFRHSDPAPARLALATSLGAGTVMGWAQVMRGAHFLSHNLWSAWIAWTLLAVLYHLLPPMKRDSRATPSSSRSSELAKHQRT